MEAHALFATLVSAIAEGNEKALSNLAPSHREIRDHVLEFPEEAEKTGLGPAGRATLISWLATPPTVALRWSQITNPESEDGKALPRYLLRIGDRRRRRLECIDECFEHWLRNSIPRLLRQTTKGNRHSSESAKLWQDVAAEFFTEHASSLTGLVEELRNDEALQLSVFRITSASLNELLLEQGGDFLSSYLSLEIRDGEPRLTRAVPASLNAQETVRPEQLALELESLLDFETEKAKLVTTAILFSVPVLDNLLPSILVDRQGSFSLRPFVENPFLGSGKTPETEATSGAEPEVEPTAKPPHPPRKKPLSRVEVQHVEVQRQVKIAMERFVGTEAGKPSPLNPGDPGERR